MTAFRVKSLLSVSALAVSVSAITLAVSVSALASSLGHFSVW